MNISTDWYITAWVDGTTAVSRVSESDALLFARANGLVQAKDWNAFPAYSLQQERVDIAEPMLAIQALHCSKEKIEEFLSKL